MRSSSVLATIACVIALVLTAGPAISSAAAIDDKYSVYAIGDSVMLGAQPCLENRGYVVDARGSRNAAAVPAELPARQSLPGQVVIHTGTNGGADRADLDAIMEAIGHKRQVIWLTVQLPDGTSRYTFEEETNRAIRAMPRRYANAHLADWNAASDAHPGWTWGDGIHLTPDGCRGYTRMIATVRLQILRDTVQYVPMGPPRAAAMGGLD